MRSSVVVFAGCLLAASAAFAARPPPALTQAEIALSEGLWAYVEGDYEQAAERFREAAAASPADAAARDWLALALLRLEGERAAPAEIERLERALAAAEPAPIDRRPALEGRLSAAAGADSNPHLLSEEIAVPLPGDPPGRLVAGSESDAVSELGLRLGFFPVYRPEGWSLGLDLDGGQSFHREFSELDLGRARAAVQLARGADPAGSLSGPLGSARVPFGSDRTSLLLQAGANHYRLGGATYLETWDGAVAFTIRETAAAATRLELAYSDRDFSGRELSDPRRSGRDAVLHLRQSFRFGGPRARGPELRLTALAADRDAGREFAASAIEGAAEVTVPLGLRWTAAFEAAARRDTFEHPESNLFDPAGPRRRDTTRRAAARLSWQAGARLLWAARVTWTDRDSNVDLGPALPDLDHRRTTATLGASWAF